ncbi:MAG: hypothetical protein GC165_09605 [Armatimonadetes bacterium]|nr:hypothetical protein [Armatimonadota bacterium]
MPDSKALSTLPYKPSLSQTSSYWKSTLEANGYEDLVISRAYNKPAVHPLISRALQVISAAIVAIAAYFGYAAYRNHRLNSQLANGYEDYVHGTLGVLPGPYLQTGDPSELKFRRIDFGNGWIRDVSEDGDMLMASYGSVPAKIVKELDNGRYSVTSNPVGRTDKVYHQNGKTDACLPALDIHLTASGKVVRITGAKEAYSVESDGRSIYDSKSSSVQSESLKAWRIGEQPTGFVTDDGFFWVSDKTEAFSYKGQSLTEISSIRNTYSSLQQSTGLGTVVVQKDFSMVNPCARICLIKDGQVRTTDLPRDILAPELAVSKSRIVFRDANDWKSKLWQYADGQFTELPIPENIVTFNVVSANSRGEIILSVGRNDATKVGQRYPYKYSLVLISQGKAYDLESTFKSLGVREVSYYSEERSLPFIALDEAGDLFFNLDHHGQTKIVELKRL